jgi:hypothetical protein
MSVSPFWARELELLVFVGKRLSSDLQGYAEVACGSDKKVVSDSRAARIHCGLEKG